MRIAKIIAFAAAIFSSATLASALDLQGHPILSDGTHAIGLQKQQGLHKVMICNEAFFIGTQETLNNYKRMRPQLEKGGYVYYHTTDPSKRFVPCAWGRYDHLDGEFF